MSIFSVDCFFPHSEKKQEDASSDKENVLLKIYSGSRLLKSLDMLFLQSVLQILSGVMEMIPLQAGQEHFEKDFTYEQLCTKSCFHLLVFSRRLEQSCSCSSNNCGLVQLVLLFPYQQMKQVQFVCAHSEKSGDFFFLLSIS